MVFKALGWGSNTKEYTVKRKTIRIQLENTLRLPGQREEEDPATEREERATREAGEKPGV